MTLCPQFSLRHIYSVGTSTSMSKTSLSVAGNHGSKKNRQDRKMQIAVSDHEKIRTKCGSARMKIQLPHLENLTNQTSNLNEVHLMDWKRLLRHTSHLGTMSKILKDCLSIEWDLPAKQELSCAKTATSKADKKLSRHSSKKWYTESCASNSKVTGQRQTESIQDA